MRDCSTIDQLKSEPVHQSRQAEAAHQHNQPEHFTKVTNVYFPEKRDIVLSRDVIFYEKVAFIY